MGRVDVAKPGLVAATLLNFPLDYQGEIHITKSWAEPLSSGLVHPIIHQQAKVIEPIPGLTATFNRMFTFSPT
jgi:hypothetical protein